MTEAEFFKQLIVDLTRFEGKFSHLYLDTKGLPTTGIGNLVATPDVAVSLPFKRSDGSDASDGEKRTAWAGVKAMKPALRAQAYEKASSLRLTEADVDALVVARLQKEFLPGLTNLYPEFSSFPTQAQSALVDMAYNCGLGGLAKFSHLKASVNTQDWRATSGNCHRVSCRDERNNWTAAQFMYAYSEPLYIR